MDVPRLGAPRHALVGRQAEVRALSRSLVERPLVTVVGPGGVGKTRLAHHVGYQLRDAFVGGVRLWDLAGCHTREEVLVRVARALDLHTVRAIPEALAAAPPTLWVLDPVEPGASAVSDLLDGWLDIAPEATFLAVSRRSLIVRGARCHRLDPLRPEDAVALFEARVADHGATLDEAAGALLPKLVQRLGLLPLAIELAAVHAAGALSVADLLAHLDGTDDLPPVSRGWGDGSLSAMVRRSWEALHERDQQALEALAEIPGGASAEGLAAALGAPLMEVHHRLARLSEHSLVRVWPCPVLAPALRFCPYESVRALLATRRQQLASAGSVWPRFAEWLLTEAKARLTSGDWTSEGQRFLRSEHDALWTIVRQPPSGDPAEAARALLLLRIPGLQLEPLAYRDAVQRALARELPRELEIALRAVEAGIRARLGEAEVATERLGALIERLDPELHDEPLQRLVLSEHAVAATEAGDGAAALRSAERALVGLPADVAPVIRAVLHNCAGNALRLLGRRADAEEHFRGGLSYLPEPSHYRACMQANLGLVCALPEGIALHEGALTTLEQLGVPSMSHAADLARLLACAGQLERARGRAEAALEEGLSSRHLGTARNASFLLAALAREAGQPVAGHQVLDRLQETFPLGDLTAGEVHSFRLTLLAEVGSFERAEEEGERALRRFARVVSSVPRDAEAMTLARLAVVAVLRDELAGAVELLARARDAVPERLLGCGCEPVLRVVSAIVALAHGSAPPVAVRDAVQQARAQVAREPLRRPLELPMLARWGQRVVARTSTERGVEIHAAGRWMSPGSDRIELDRYPLLTRLLRALVQAYDRQPGEPLDVSALMEAGWPDEQVLYEAGRSRVYVAINRLRKLGLQDVLVRREGGYLLDPSVSLDIRSD